MQKKTELIKLYCTICYLYDNRIIPDVQRLSNNFCPKFSDVECITIVLWGIINQKFTQKDTWKYIKDYYAKWFPDLPRYKAFNKRVCYLSDAFKVLCELLLDGLAFHPDIKTHIADSMPIVVAKQSRSKKAKVAKEICNVGYCESKDMYYYGVKLTAIGQSCYKSLPIPRKIALTPASHHDLKIAEQMLFDVYNIDFFGDKAFRSKEWEAHILEHNGIRIFTPIKLEKGQKRLDSADNLLSTAISRVRQPIESFFNWIQEKTQLECASKVRGTAGLMSFVFSRIAVACLMIAGTILV